MIHEAEDILLERGIAQRDQVAVFVGGLPPGQEGNTNSIRLHRVGSYRDV